MSELLPAHVVYYKSESTRLAFLIPYRHSAKLSRLLTAGTKSLHSWITSGTSGAPAGHSAPEALQQGSELQDWDFSFVNQHQNQHNLQQQPTAGSLECQRQLAANQQQRRLTFPVFSVAVKDAVAGLRPSAAGANKNPHVYRHVLCLCSRGCFCVLIFVV